MKDTNELLPENSGGSRKQSSRVYIAIIAMLVIWFAVLVSRNHIWAHWYGYQITHTDDMEARLDAFRRLVSLGEYSRGVAKDLARDDDVGARSMGIALLATMPESDENCDYLVEVAKQDPDSDIRRSAIRAIGSTSNPKYLAALKDILFASDVPDDTCREVVLLLVTQHSEAALPVLLEYLDTANGLNLVQVIQGFGLLREDEAIEHLVPLLESEETCSGCTAFDQIGEMILANPNSPAPEARERNYYIGLEAARALQKITGEHFGYPTEDDPAGKKKAIESWKTWFSEHHTQPGTQE